MNAKTTMTMVIALVAMIGMTGLSAAMNTNVQYTGDGSYNCNYNAAGTGYIGIHTFTSDGSDHLTSGWTNSKVSGWQTMNTFSGQAFGGDYTGTMIDRSATVGGANVGEDEAGFIRTLTTDNGDNLVYTYANYHDNKGYGSHVTTDQTVVVGSLIDIAGQEYNVTGVAAITRINGYSYGSDTTISGLVRTQSGDDYTYAYIQMDNGKMKLYTFSATGSVDPTFMVDGACGQIVDVDVDGEGVFKTGAGTDMHGAYFYMTDDLGTMDYTSSGMGVNMSMSTTFDGEFTADGYVYAIDLP